MQENNNFPHLSGQEMEGHATVSPNNTIISITFSETNNSNSNDANKHASNNPKTVEPQFKTKSFSNPNLSIPVEKENADIINSEQCDLVNGVIPSVRRTMITNNLGSPRSALARFIPSIPNDLNDPDKNVLCDNKVFFQNASLCDLEKAQFVHNPSLQISFSLDDEEYENIEQAFSKSYDCSKVKDAADYGPTMSRSFSEDFLQRSSSTYPRRVSVVSTKGKLLGCPRVLPGETMRSSSAGLHPPRKPIHDDDDTSIELKKKRKFTSEQKWIAFCLCLVDFTAFLSMSIIAPFFPREAAAKGMREAVSGFVFSIYALVVMVASPIFGKLMPTIGAKFMFLTGIFFCGVCNILFGLLDKVEGELEFTVLCFIVRSFEALGAAAFSTASCTILIDQFPDDIGTIFGISETCIGVGMSIGPAIGGALYSVGGFGLPFFTLGVFVVLTAPICWFLMRSVEDPEVVMNSNVSYTKLLSQPHVIIVCLILVVGSQAQGFIDPTLEPHMRQYNLDTGIIGLLFLLLSGAYAISSPIVGWVTGKVESKYPVMIVGLSFLTLALLLLGPSDILHIPGSLWLSIFALILMGFSFAAAYVPTFESMFIAAMNGGLDDDINTYSIVSGLWNCMYSLGEVTGPSLGGILSDFFTFPEASTFMAAFTAIAFVVAVIAWINPCHCLGPLGLVEIDDSRPNTPDSISTLTREQKEQSPLQSGSVHNSYGTLSDTSRDPIVDEKPSTHILDM